MASVGPDFIRQGLLSRGLPAHIAEGFVMNIADESGFNPAINEISPTVSGSRGGFGLYQLTGPRRVAFERFAADRGVSASDPNAQLDFLMTELQGPEARAARSIFSAQDAPTAAAAIARDFLRPAPENLQRRVARYTGITPEQSVARDTRQALGFDAPTGATQMEQQQQPGGIRGLLSNPDFLDSLAIGFGGLTQNPNQALMQMSADRIAGRAQTRQDTQSKNKTIEFLRAQPGGERFVQLVDAIGAVAALKAYQDSQEPAPDRGQILSAVQMREMFPGTQIEDGLYNLKPDGTANKVGGGGTTVNLDQRSEGKFEEAFATGDAKTITDVYSAGLMAQRNLGRIDQLEQALASAPSGGLGVIKQVAGEFGIATEGLGDLQAAQALINSLVPEQRQPGSGPMSDADLALFKQSLPRIVNQPDGNRRIIETMRAIAEYDQSGAAIVQQMRSGEIDRAQAFQLMQQRPNPLAGFRAPAGDAPADGAPSSGAPAIRTFNPQTGQLE